MSIIKDQVNYNDYNFNEYYVVKIAGKGNIEKNDVRNINLSKNIYDSVEKIKYFINNSNILNKKVAIVWDGDNFQDQDHDSPSPFTNLIFELSKVENYYMFGLKHKKEDNPWKDKHVNTWRMMEFTKLYNIIEPHKLFNTLCNMYISYGSTNFKYKNDNPCNVETSGYLQLYDFKNNYNLNILYNDAVLGFEIYSKNTM
tara:strand:+ start:296 stop:892 length:597 start_codon:yes stop_codon:yes gene_type:complete